MHATTAAVLMTLEIGDSWREVYANCSVDPDDHEHEPERRQAQ